MNKFFTAQRLKDTAYVTVGAFILAISINAVLLPNKLVAGGANGISIVINYVFGISPAIVLYAINIPLLVLCFLLLGKEVGVKTIYGSLIYPFFVGITSGMPVLTHNIFLAALFGGIITGAGLGLVFRGNASTGGTAIISQIVNKYFKVSLVILSAMYAFNADIVLFSLICLFTIGRVVDMIQVGLVRSKNVMIISPKYVAIQERLLRELDKGVTLVPIEGGYRSAKGMLLMTVIREKDFPRLKEAILEIDEEAFLISMSASEVYGKGFSLKKVADSYGVEATNANNLQ